MRNGGHSITVRLILKRGGKMCDNYFNALTRYCNLVTKYCDVMIDYCDQIDNTLTEGYIKMFKPMSIKVKYFADIEPLKKIYTGDWIDLRATETIKFKKGEIKKIPLGIGMILPDGYEAHILPRSSTPLNFGIILLNSMGVIDNSFNGDNDEWGFLARAIRKTVINKNDRIAQFRIVKNQPLLTFLTVEKLNDTNRGSYGSTGIN